MYNKDGIYIAPKDLNFNLTFKEKIKGLSGDNWKKVLLRIFHWNDTYGKHLERYYNLPSVKKSILAISTTKKGV